MRKLVFISLLSILIPFAASSQTIKENYERIKPNFTFEIWNSALTNGDRDGASLVDMNHINYPAFNFMLGWQSKTDGPCAAFAEALNYPVYGIGFGYEHTGMLKSNYTTSRLGDIFNLFGFFEGALYRNKIVTLGLTLRLGVGMTFDIYNRETNPENVHFGAPTSLYIAVGPQVKIRPTPQLELGANAFWWHHSNGHTWTPNTGINQRGIGLSARYSLEEPYTGKRSKNRIHKGEFEKGFNYDVNFHAGMHAYKAEWFAFNKYVLDPEMKKVDFTSWSRLGVTADVAYRYSLLCSTGLEFDMTYMWGLDRLEAADRILYGDSAVNKSKGYNPVMLMTGIVHEFYYGNISAYIGAGVYLLHKVGIYEDSSPFYEKIGMRFYVPNWNNVYIGWNIHARNFTEADHFEFQLGVRFKSRKK